MTWCKSYDCRNSQTERNEFCVSCVQMLARADAHEDKWPSGNAPSRSDMDGAMGDREPETVPVDDMPKRILGNVLIDGPDGQCAYIHAGIDQRCPKKPDAHTFVEHGDEWVRVEMCAEHAREDVPTFTEWKQEVLRT